MTSPSDRRRPTNHSVPSDSWVREVGRWLPDAWRQARLGPAQARPTIRLVRRLESGAEWQLTTTSSVTVADVTKASARLASALNLHGRLVQAVDVAPSGWEGHATLRIYERDPVTIPRPIPWGPGETPMRHPGDLAEVGRTRSGDAAKVPLERTHALFGGQNDSGKSSGVKVCVANLAPFDSVEIVVLDAAKNGLGYGMLSGRVEVVGGFAAVERRLGELLARLRKRAHQATRLGHDDGVRQFTSSCPMVVMVVEEGPALVASKAAVATVRALVQETRAVGGVVLFVAQNPQHTAVDTVLRGELKARYAFRTANADGARAILGHLASEDVGPHTIPKTDAWQGVAYGDLDGAGVEVVRWYHAPDAWLAELNDVTKHCVPAARW